MEYCLNVPQDLLTFHKSVQFHSHSQGHWRIKKLFSHTRYLNFHRLRSLKYQQKDVKKLLVCLFVLWLPMKYGKPTERCQKSCTFGCGLFDRLRSLKNNRKMSKSYTYGFWLWLAEHFRKPTKSCQKVVRSVVDSLIGWEVWKNNRKMSKSCTWGFWLWLAEKLKKPTVFLACMSKNKMQINFCRR